MCYLDRVIIAEEQPEAKSLLNAAILSFHRCQSERDSGVGQDAAIHCDISVHAGADQTSEATGGFGTCLTDNLPSVDDAIWISEIQEAFAVEELEQ